MGAPSAAQRSYRPDHRIHGHHGIILLAFGLYLSLVAILVVLG